MDTARAGRAGEDRCVTATIGDVDLGSGEKLESEVSVSHTRIESGNELVGYALTLGPKYVFYTADKALEALNEKRFPTLAAVRCAVTEAKDTGKAAA